MTLGKGIWCGNQSTRDVISVDWFPHQIPFPKVTTDDYLTHTDEYMLDLIRQKLAPTRKKTIPLLMYGSKLLNAYTEMAKLLQRAPEMPVTPQIPAPPPRVETPTQIEQPQNNPSPQILAQPSRVEINNQHKIRKIK